MELIKSDNIDFNEEVQALAQLTNYPPVIVRDIIKADRMYTLDKICDDMHDTGELPDRYSFSIPGYGEIRLTRMAKGRTTDARWIFIPTEDFKDGFFNSFYYDISPVYDKAKMNFDEIVKSRVNNLLK